MARAAGPWNTTLIRRQTRVLRRHGGQERGGSVVLSLMANYLTSHGLTRSRKTGAFALGCAGLRDGGTARRHEHHGGDDGGRDARVEADGAARERRGADLSGQTIRARDWTV